MTTRPPFDQIYMEFAYSLSRRSTCSRSQVGTVITTADNRRVVAVGYNGGPANGRNECKTGADGLVIPGQCGHLHSEINAIIGCDHTGYKNVYVTMQPCEACAIALVNLHASRGPIKEVVFGEAYRLKEGLQVLHDANIPVYQLKQQRDLINEPWIRTRIEQQSPTGI